jgi:hypothetical protein
MVGLWQPQEMWRMFDLVKNGCAMIDEQRASTPLEYVHPQIFPASALSTDVLKADRQGASVRPTNGTSLRKLGQSGQDGWLPILPISSESDLSWLKLVPFVRPTAKCQSFAASAWHSC